MNVETATDVLASADAKPDCIRIRTPEDRVVGIYTLSKDVRVDNTPLHLTNHEYRMFELLALCKGTTVSKEMFLDVLYGGHGGNEPEMKIIDVVICTLRRKLANALNGENLVQTVWGRGYLLSDAAEALKEADESPTSGRKTLITGPYGRPLTQKDLPRGNTVRWVIRRKAEVVAAVRGGLLSADEARKRYSLSREEYLRWERGVDRFGPEGLRTTRIQQYRHR